MKTTFLLLFFLGYSVSSAQSVTYSKYEEKMIQYVNNAWAYAGKYKSHKDYQVIIDSCQNFLKQYPNSFVKPAIFLYILDMKTIISKSMNEINPLIDSVLHYDNLPATQLQVAEILTLRHLDIRRAHELILNVLPKLTVQRQRFNAYHLLAIAEMSLGDYMSARTHFENAIQTDSTRPDGWYDYIAYFKMLELNKEAAKLEKQFTSLEKDTVIKYIYSTPQRENLLKNFHRFILKDINNRPVAFNQFVGKVVVVNVFNFWCSECVKEFPSIQRLTKEFPKVKFIFVNRGETPQELKGKYFKKPQFAFLGKSTLVFSDSTFSQAVYIEGVPHTFVLSKIGEVRFDYLGFDEGLEKVLSANLIELLREE